MNGSSREFSFFIRDLDIEKICYVSSMNLILRSKVYLMHFSMVDICLIFKG